MIRCEVDDKYRAAVMWRDAKRVSGAVSGPLPSGSGGWRWVGPEWGIEYDAEDNAVALVKWPRHPEDAYWYVDRVRKAVKMGLAAKRRGAIAGLPKSSVVRTEEVTS